MDECYYCDDEAVATMRVESPGQTITRRVCYDCASTIAAMHNAVQRAATADLN